MSDSARDPQFGYDDHFTPARTRKKRKNRPTTEPPSPSVLLDKTSEELAANDWLRDTKQILRESLEEAFASSDIAPDVLCLGLGSPSSSRDARAQLAFLLAACDDLRIDRTKVSVFDPVFAEQDIHLLAQRGLVPFTENHVARHAVDTPTIVFMPHCDLHLYENLFRENWSLERLSNILLIANRLSEYADSTPSRKLAADHPCVARLAPYLTSRTLQPYAPYPTAFNNTALQFVRTSALAEREPNWWVLPPRSNPRLGGSRPGSTAMAPTAAVGSQAEARSDVIVDVVGARRLGSNSSSSRDRLAPTPTSPTRIATALSPAPPAPAPPSPPVIGANGATGTSPADPTAPPPSDAASTSDVPVPPQRDLVTPGSGGTRTNGPDDAAQSPAGGVTIMTSPAES
ncbi:hypothetical protein C8Q80DRAFT_1120536 [Daedaleopsis nitida]|nr:hypothetical protein C8Q80DRAFT_1120536 [Daedaleopsis nitida]